MHCRGVSPQAIRNFCDSLAVAKTDGVVDMAQFEHFIRDDLNQNARRAMCVLKPLLLTFTNYNQSELFSASSHPQRDNSGSRELPFDRQIYIDQSDFSEDAAFISQEAQGFMLGEYVRLRGAYIIRADQVIRDAAGEIQEIKASVVENTVGEDAPEGIRPRGVIHWVSALNAVDCTVNQYDRLFNQALPDAGEGDFTDYINPESLKVLKGCKAEASLADARSLLIAINLEREGCYFVAIVKQKPLYLTAPLIRDQLENLNGTKTLRF